MRFSLFQNLRELDIKFTGKFRLTDESFKSDLPTETLLNLRIDIDGLQPNSIETNALSYAYRPINVFLVHPENLGKQQCKLLTLEEEIYAPFLAVNPENRIRINSCPILCDCSIKWLFDAPKDWWMRVEAGDNNIGLQCDDSRSLYFYSDYDFRSCPKTNLLKYFLDSDSKLSTASPLGGESLISASYSLTDNIAFNQNKTTFSGGTETSENLFLEDTLHDVSIQHDSSVFKSSSDDSQSQTSEILSASQTNHPNEMVRSNQRNETIPVEQIVGSPTTVPTATLKIDDEQLA